MKHLFQHTHSYEGLVSLIAGIRPALVGEVGADPTVPEDNGFTVRRSCRFATLPYSFVIGGPSGDRTRGATIKSRVPYHSATGPYCGGKPRYRPEHLGVADHCLTSWLVYHIGTQSRSRTYDLPLRRRLLLFAELLGHIGAEEGIRTHTAQFLRLLPPSVGLPRQRKENARVLPLAIQFSMSIPPSALYRFRSLGYIPDKYQTTQILPQVYCTLPDLVRILQWLLYYEFYHMGG